MWVLILLYGITTRSWYAWLALRRRVSMSAIGSVIDIVCGAFLAAVSGDLRRASSWRLPGRLRDAGQLAGVGHLAQADPAQAERPVDRPGTPAAVAARVAPDLELRLRGGLVDQRRLGHVGCVSLLLAVASGGQGGGSQGGGGADRGAVGDDDNAARRRPGRRAVGREVRRHSLSSP